MRETGKRRWAAPAVLGAAFLLAALCIPSFRHPKIYLTILKNGAYNGIMALGLLFVLLCGEIDLSVSAQLSFFGVLCAVLLKKGVPVLLAALVMLAAAGLVGSLMGAAIFGHRAIGTINRLNFGKDLKVQERYASHMDLHMAYQKKYVRYVKLRNALHELET